MRHAFVVMMSKLWLFELATFIISYADINSDGNFILLLLKRRKKLNELPCRPRQVKVNPPIFKINSVNNPLLLHFSNVYTMIIKILTIYNYWF